MPLPFDEFTIYYALATCYTNIVRSRGKSSKVKTDFVLTCCNLLANYRPALHIENDKFGIRS